MTFVDDGTTYALNTDDGDKGQTVSDLEPGRYRVTFRKRKTDGKPKSISGEEVVYLEPGVHFDLTPSHGIEVTVPISLRGRNWPAGPVFTVNYITIF